MRIQVQKYDKALVATYFPVYVFLSKINMEIIGVSPYNYQYKWVSNLDNMYPPKKFNYPEVKADYEHALKHSL